MMTKFWQSGNAEAMSENHQLEEAYDDTKLMTAKTYVVAAMAKCK